MMFTKYLSLVTVLALAACNTVKPKDDGKKAGTPGGVAIDTKIDDGKTDDGTKPITNETPATKPPTGTGAGTDTQPEPPKADAECYKGDPTICKIEAEILRLTNEERAKPSGFRQARGPLKLAPKMSFVARDWSEKQADRGRIGHDGFPNQRSRLFSQEFNGSRAEMSAENVAMTGWGGEADVARQFFEMWRKSPGHYANMMGDYAAMGIGVAQSDNGWYATELFGDE